MKDDRVSRGKWGERAAVRYLSRRGFRILDRNWSVRRGEIDIVARDKDALVFVEVRTRKSSSMVSPEETIRPAKQRKLFTLAREYMARHELFDVEIRFDLVAVRYGKIGLIAKCDHYKGILQRDD